MVRLGEGFGGRGEVWRRYDEVFDLARDGAGVLAATDGGLLRDGAPIPSPAGLRTIEDTAPLVLGLADGRRLRQEGERWVPIVDAAKPRDLDHGLRLEPNAAWPLGPPPPAHPYAALRLGGTLFAGTTDGLFRYSAGGWTRQALPSALPLPRPNGIAERDGAFVVGGLGGLFIGHPGAWRRVGEDAIRAVTTVGGEIWIVHGDGALDRIDPAADRLYPDVLAGNARRPWTSCVGASNGAPIFGGQGGWEERGGNGQYPSELKGDVVTAIVGKGATRWVGTQKTGLLRDDAKGVRRWNPGNGLTDPWVTALLPTPNGLVIGTARRGLFRLVGDRIAPLPCPTLRVTALATWHGDIAVGGMDGAWLASGGGWRNLDTQGEETTALTVLGDRLAITTAAGVFFQLSASQSVR